MNAKELLDNIKAMFSAPVVPVIPTEPTINTILATETPFKLKDGGEVLIILKEGATAPSIGDMVMIAGKQAPAADYVLEDGSVITVNDGGTITVIGEPVPVTQPDFTAPDATPKPTLEERARAIEEKISAIESKISGFEMQTGLAIESQQQATEAKITKQDAVIKQMFELCEKLVAEPMTEPVTLNGAKKEKFDRIQKRDERFTEIAEALKKTKQLS